MESEAIKSRTAEWITKLVGPLLHPVALFSFYAEFESFHLPQRWKVQFSLLLLFSFLLASLLTRVRRLYLAELIMTLRFFALLVMGFPLGENLLIEGILLLSLIFDVFLWFNPWVGVAVSVLLVAVTLLFQPDSLVWNTYQHHASWYSIVAFVFLYGILILIFFLFSSYKAGARTNRVLIDSYEESVANLMEANLKLQENIMKEIGDTLNTERKRIARELHDIIGHSMVNIMMLSESMYDKMHREPEKTVEMMKMVNTEAQRVVHDTEKTLRYLKDMDSERKYDIAAVKRLVNVFQKATGVQVLLELRNVPNSFGRNANRIVYRTIQECMTNSFRHGKADRIKIMFWESEDEVELIIRDNGTGTKQINEGIGLWGIRERLAAIEGSLEVQSSRNGFIVIVRFPWNGRS